MFRPACQAAFFLCLGSSLLGASATCSNTDQVAAYTACGIPLAGGMPDSVLVCSTDCKTKSDACPDLNIGHMIHMANCASTDAGNSNMNMNADHDHSHAPSPSSSDNTMLVCVNSTHHTMPGASMAMLNSAMATDPCANCTAFPCNIDMGSPTPAPSNDASNARALTILLAHVTMLVQMIVQVL
jgi:hypothetical protein